MRTNNVATQHQVKTCIIKKLIPRIIEKLLRLQNFLTAILLQNIAAIKVGIR